MGALTEYNTIREAKQHLNKHLDKGCVCPACEQICKRYTRKLSSSMAYGLYLIYKLSVNRENQWIHLEDEFKKLTDVPSAIRGDLPKLRYWSLIEKLEHAKDDGNPNSGFYRITKAGEDFINGKSSVRKYVKIYNNQLYGFDGDFTTFKQALGSKFNYEQLMNRRND